MRIDVLYVDGCPCIRLTEVEPGFRTHTRDPSIRLAWHQKAERGQAHILVCFPA